MERIYEYIGDIMKRFFIIYGVIICLIFGYASLYGIDLSDSFKSGKWDPKGKSAYHK